ncbi:hypothetical protein BRADI_1g60531v3 [Brachypodium distachyon]|uniref:TF-B3 domain-containing protein n=2 Tax=Brachypodium distachyon TaxID=15368 RepID=A0A0Q3KAF8_BRADI|nr:hypothetical protein BRADI_1g60531v3 [Brachypodium distachyon]
MAEANSYEEQRRRQVEENKRKLEELRLHHLSAAVREAAAKPKQKRKAPAQRDAGKDAPRRRSNRIASIPERPNYRENAIYSQKQKELKPDHAYAVSKAEELKDELSSDYPTFVRPMTQTLSNLHIPSQFSTEHLPQQDARVYLVDDDEEEYRTFYRPHTSSLNKGWREFAVDHELVDGDCLVFQLIKKAFFKVYIFRASSYYEDDH